MSAVSKFGAIGALIFGAGLLTAGAALGAPEVPSGPYEVTMHARDGSGDQTQTWTFTPCGPSCTIGDGVFTQRVEYHLSNGRWVSHQQEPEIPCPAGGTVPRTVNSSIDAVTLVGEWQATQDAPCGSWPAGSLYGPWDFELTKAG